MTELRYRYPVDALSLGCSLGNRRSFARLDACTDLRGLWGSFENQFVLGEWRIDVLVNGKKAVPVETTFEAESQTTLLQGPDVRIWKQFFLPFDEEGDAQLLQSAVFILRIKNSSSSPAEVRLLHSIIWPAVQCDLFTKQPPENQTTKKVKVTPQSHFAEISTVDRPGEVRIFGHRRPWKSIRADDRSMDAEYVVLVAPGGEAETSFVVSFSFEGRDLALEGYLQCENAGQVLQKTRENLARILARSLIVTPDPLINRSLQWAKVNMLRVQHEYRLGDAFTNDPPQDIVVLRDVAWYILGSDYLTPRFSGKLLDLAERYAFHEGGKVTEYVHANEDPPAKHDYDLNINDDTPLLVWALLHHALCGGEEFPLERVLPLMMRACDWILQQIHDGLVRCAGEGTYVWGICGWRNIIDGYTLTGAVTEINAECYQALMLTAATARKIGRAQDANRYDKAARELEQTINSRLISETTGLYLLNITNDGTRRHDITGDLIFPAMFGVAGPRVRNAILKELTEPDMWTPFGSRTVSPRESNYDPDAGYQLRGGVWPNLTAWIAYELRREFPEKLIEGMLNIYRLSDAERPAEYVNVVPGQFPERLQGSTFQSRGMSLSPWTPPTYLWLAIEGLLGINPTLDGLEVNPSIPAGWEWVCVKDLPYREGMLSAFLIGGELYVSQPLSSTFAVNIGIELPTRVGNEEFYSIGMALGDDVLLFVASEEGGEGSVSIECHGSWLTKEIVLAEAGATLVRFEGAYRHKSTQAAERSL